MKLIKYYLWVFLFPALSVTAQPSQSSSTDNKNISGRITNDRGVSLGNVNVVIESTGRGTVTNANGEFKLKAVTPDDIIRVSLIGYATQHIPVKGRSEFKIFMEPTAEELDKVVIQAYGTTSQRLATGNIGVVRAEDIAKQPVMNPLIALQGQVAGAVVTSTTGYASGTVKVEIRGRNTINPNFPSDPLYIVDGVPLTILNVSPGSSYSDGSQGSIQSGLPSPANGQSPLFSLNPQDIEALKCSRTRTQRPFMAPEPPMALY